MRAPGAASRSGRPNFGPCSSIKRIKEGAAAVAALQGHRSLSSVGAILCKYTRKTNKPLFFSFFATFPHTGRIEEEGVGEESTARRSGIGANENEERKKKYKRTSRAHSGFLSGYCGYLYRYYPLGVCAAGAVWVLLVGQIKQAGACWGREWRDGRVREQPPLCLCAPCGPWTKAGDMPRNIFFSRGERLGGQSGPEGKQRNPAAGGGQGTIQSHSSSLTSGSPSSRFEADP